MLDRSSALALINVGIVFQDIKENKYCRIMRVKLSAQMRMERFSGIVGANDGIIWCGRHTATLLLET